MRKRMLKAVSANAASKRNAAAAVLPRMRRLPMLGRIGPAFAHAPCLQWNGHLRRSSKDSVFTDKVAP